MIRKENLTKLTINIISLLFVLFTCHLSVQISLRQVDSPVVKHATSLSTFFRSIIASDKLDKIASRIINLFIKLFDRHS